MLKSFRTPSRRYSRFAQGFTLIEALIALAVVSCLLGAIESVVANSVLGARAIEQHLAMVQMARRLLVSRARFTDSLGTTTGETEGLVWKVAAAPFLKDDQTTTLIPIKLRIEVRAPNGGSFYLETIRLKHEPKN